MRGMGAPRLLVRGLLWFLGSMVAASSKPGFLATPRPMLCFRLELVVFIFLPLASGCPEGPVLNSQLFPVYIQ